MRLSAALLAVLLTAAALAGVGSALGPPVADRPLGASSHADPVAEPQFIPASEVDPAVVSGTSVTEMRTNGTQTDQSTTNGTSANDSVADRTNIQIALRENGDARWRVSARFVLEDPNETAAFERLASEYENGRADAGFSRDTFVRLAERAAADENRTMAIRRVGRSTELREGGRVGVLRLTFTWTNFSAASDERLVLGDVFWTDSGTWLPSLADDQTLVIDAPADYYVFRSTPPHNGTEIRYEGPRTFDEGDFSVTYEVQDGSTSPGGLPNISEVSGIILAVFLLGAFGAGAYAWTLRRGDEPAEPPAAADATAVPTSESAARNAPAAADAETESDDEPDEELLSDEERVTRLLEANDGRMKQANIVKETNWSNAKVSQLLSAMADEGKVDKLRIGRENLITLPDEDVTDVE